MTARRGDVDSVDPDDAMVYVNDLLIGQANQFDKPDEVYDFPAPGSYTIRISAPGYHDRQFIVTRGQREAEVAKIDDCRLETARAPPAGGPGPQRLSSRKSRLARRGVSSG